jgi:hypothetical protein
MLGLCTGDTINRSPMLEVFGFPELGRAVLFQVRSAGSAITATVFLGTSNPNMLLPSGCRQLTSADIGSLPPIQTSSMGDGSVLLNLTSPALLHQHVYAQAGTSTGLLSNGLRLSIGGIVP